MVILRTEGSSELFKAFEGNKLAKAAGLDKVLAKWEKLLVSLDDVVEQLAKGGDISLLAGKAKTLGLAVGELALLTSEALSFIPGPVGIVCSLVNAIVCFSSGNIVGGLLELLGCIPGAKAGTKGASVLMNKVGGRIVKAISEAPELAKILKEVKELEKLASKFNVANLRKSIDEIWSKSCKTKYASSSENIFAKVTGDSGRNFVPKSSSSVKSGGSIMSKGQVSAQPIVGAKLDVGGSSNKLHFGSLTASKGYRMTPKPPLNTRYPDPNAMVRRWEQTNRTMYVSPLTNLRLW